MPSSVRLVLVVWTDSFELAGYCAEMSRRFALSLLLRLWCLAGFVWTTLRWLSGLCLDGNLSVLGSGDGKISATGCGGLSDNLSRPSRLSRLDRYKMRIRVDLSRHALYISVWTV